jgi:hypothetical protein
MCDDRIREGAMRITYKRQGREQMVEQIIAAIGDIDWSTVSQASRARREARRDAEISSMRALIEQETREANRWIARVLGNGTRLVRPDGISITISSLQITIEGGWSCVTDQDAIPIVLTDQGAIPIAQIEAAIAAGCKIE